MPDEQPIVEDTLERMVRRNVSYRGFLIDLLDPERFGHSVTAEVRDKARELLGMPGRELPQAEVLR
jgi:hypothetical protein